MLGRLLRSWLTNFGVLASHPTAFLVVSGYAALWLIFSPRTFDWHAGAVLATWFMTLFIQRATHRDTQAIQAKLDELLRVDRDARSELTRLDEKDPEEIERHRETAKARDRRSATR
jgi:low affinity Fe/Cu permease